MGSVRALPFGTANAPATRWPLRLWAAGAVLAVEMCAVAVAGHPWMNTHQVAAGPVVFLGALLFFGRAQLRGPWPGWQPPARRFALVHVVALACVLAATCGLYRQGGATGASQELLLCTWLLALAVAAASLLFTVVAPAEAATLARRLGGAWGYAALATAVALWARRIQLMAWDAPDSALGQHLVTAAFAGVRWLLGLVYGDLVVHPESRVLGTGRFCIRVAGTCSGIEGMALILALTGAWILYERRSLHVARALLLVPAAVGLAWTLNLFRIATLIALGTAGYGTLALSGFHTEAGWIALVAISAGFLLLVQRVAWFRVDGDLPAARLHSGSLRHDAAYLLPFMAILAAGLFTRALSTGFETLYPLRWLAAAAVLWWFRGQYRAMAWRASWVGVASGVAVGAVWVAFAHTPGPGNMGHALNGLSTAGFSTAGRHVWLALRVLAAVTTVPIAEELAFRGFLARRVTAEEVDRVPWPSMSWTGIVLSSVAFAAMHGRWWALGLGAGIAFALLAKYRGGLGEAVTAHAVANLLIAAWALAFHDYSMW